MRGWDAVLDNHREGVANFRQSRYLKDGAWVAGCFTGEGRGRVG